MRILIWTVMAVAVAVATVRGAGPGSVGAALGSVGRARVVVVSDPAATVAFAPQRAIVEALVERGVMALTQQGTAAAAWLSLVSTQDVVGLKVVSAPGPLSGTRPAVVEAVARGLMAAGVPGERIVIWDRQSAPLRAAGYPALAERLGVRWASSGGAGYDEREFYEKPLVGQLVFGDREFAGPPDAKEGLGRKSFVTRLLTGELTKVISIAPLMNHNLAGVHGHLYSLALGSVDNTLRFEGDGERLAEAVPEIYSLPAIEQRVVLLLTDALIAQYLGEENMRLHYSTSPNELWFSHDPVALDVLAARHLEAERETRRVAGPRPARELYRGAALIDLGVADPDKISLERVR